MGPNNKQQFKGCFYFHKSCSSIYNFKKSGAILNVGSGAGKVGFSSLSAYCASKFGLVGLPESLVLEVSEHQNIQVLTIFLGEVATKMWQEYDFRYYQKNKSKMLQPKDVAEKIAEMISDTKTYKNGDSFEMYSNDI
jgi:3-oxoacyl-[acyl-carrier protein] reductase